jgi:DNA-directed RNA polymerase specialized sigma24 family protein
LIVESYKTEVISEELADSICKIANKLSFHPRFINYTYKEEMVGDAIEKMLKAVTNKKYDPNLGNAFAYFTRITYNAFFNRINKEKKEKEFVLSLQDVAYTDMENAGFETITDEYPEEKYYE